MEYVIVKYPRERQRSVYVDGQKAGLLNRIIRVEAGTHRFSLEEPKDYEPDEVELSVQGTSAVQPAIVEFDEADL